MGRTLVVGDVHGCSAELSSLLDRLAFVRGTDALVFVGDLVARGPDSRGVLDIVRETGAIAVRGNHEDRLLDWHRATRARERGEFALVPDLGRMHGDVAESLRAEDWALLSRMPVTHLLPAHRLLVVHAGVVPGVALTEQDPATMMRIRSLSDHGEARDHGGATPWGLRYVGPPHIAFGHAASLEAQIHPWATGVDTGCVYGGYLTAMVLHEGQEPPPARDRRAVLVSVPARRRYFGGIGVGGRAMVGEQVRLREGPHVLARGPGPHAARRVQAPAGMDARAQESRRVAGRSRG